MHGGYRWYMMIWESWFCRNRILCLYCVLASLVVMLLLSQSRRCTLSVWAGHLIQSPEWVGWNCKAEGTWNVISSTESQPWPCNIDQRTILQLFCKWLQCDFLSAPIRQFHRDEKQRCMWKLSCVDELSSIIVPEKMVPEAVRREMDLK